MFEVPLIGITPLFPDHIDPCKDSMSLIEPSIIISILRSLQ
jgi:hypothetical protein